MPRRLPPSAVPLTPSDLTHGLRASSGAHARFQSALAEYLGAPACRLAASGRTALFLLLTGLREAADQPARREVLMPAYTCPALAKVALDVGLQPRFIDISPHTLAFADGQLEAHLGERTLAVILVHPFGIPQPVEPALAVAHAAGALVIEDAAQALGARLGGRPVGALGDFGLFSLGPGKPLSTGGGGIVCANDERYVDLLERAWQALPWPSPAASGWAAARLALFTLAFHPRGWWLATRIGLHRIGDQEASWGYALRGLSQFQAALGLALLARLEAINDKRRENARRLMACLHEMGYAHVPSPPAGAEPIYLRLPVLVDSAERRERLFRGLWAAGLGAGRMYRHPLPRLFPQLGAPDCPGAAQVAHRLLTLPTHHYLTHADVEQIIEFFQAASHIHG